MEHLDDILPEWLLGTLEPARRDAASRHLEGCARCRAELTRLAPAVDALGTLVVPVQPPAEALPRLMREMEGPGRFARWGGQVAAFLDVTKERALSLLESMADPNNWMPGPVDGVELMPVEAGPAREGMMAAIVRLLPGARYPRHTHQGREWNLVLEGGFREDNGHEVWPGEELEKTDGSMHDFTALQGPACIAVTVLDGVTAFEDL
ncbi:transcriptional regulator [Corallococcus sp. CA047B]|uniref:cupin domain-containing protein n=1 Tax=Corallococcus sp. CA047B TaxID=2316729 RepID=UPI000EA0A433|nr:dimethylsulfonioproprionate lyase family protein [Corallococcus sp. CA047B]RKH08124.1 transcriptional regulator [Corallococcus sp. CA047B]